MQRLRSLRIDEDARRRFQHLPSSELSPLTLAKKEIELREKVEEEKIKREIEARRFRLGADPLPVLSEKVRTEVVAASDAELLMLELLQAERDACLAEKCIVRLQRKIPALADPSMTERLLSLAKEYQDESTMAAKVVLDFTDYDSPEALSPPRAEGPFAALLTIAAMEPHDLTSLQDQSADSPYVALTLVLECWGRGDLSHTHRFITTAKALLERMTTRYGTKYPQCRRWLARLEGLVLARGGNFDEAITILEQLESPEDAEVSNALLSCYVAAKSHAKAIDLYHLRLAATPDEADLLAGLGWEYYCFGDAQEALVHLHRAAKAVDPSDNTLLATIQLRLGRVYWEMDEQNRRDKSICLHYFLSSAKANPEGSEAFLLLGRYYAGIGRDPQRAEKCLARALQLDSDCVEAAVELSGIWLAEANEEEADVEDLLLRVVRVLEPFGSIYYRNALLWTNLGAAQLALKRYAPATIAFQNALKGDRPDEKRCLLGLGEGYRRQGRYTAATKVYTRLLEIDPNCVTAKYGLAAVNLQLQEYDVSQAMLAQVLEAVGGDRPKVEMLKAYVLQIEDHLRLACVSDVIVAASKAIRIANEILPSMASTAPSRLKCLTWKLVSSLSLLLVRIARTDGFGVLAVELEQLLEHLVSKFDGNEIWNGIQSALPPLLPKSRTLLIQIAALCQSSILVESEEEVILSAAWLDLAATLLQFVVCSSEPVVALLLMAKDCAEQAVDTSSGPNAPALFVLGYCHFLLENYALAQHHLINSIHADARPSEAHIALAHLYSTLGDEELARLSLAPVLISADSALGWQYQCILLSGQVEAAPHVELSVVLRQASELSDASEHPIHLLHALQMAKSLASTDPLQRLEILMGIKIRMMRRLVFVPDCATARHVLQAFAHHNVFDHHDGSLWTEEGERLYLRALQGETVDVEERLALLARPASEDTAPSELWLRCFFSLPPADESDQASSWRDFLENLRCYFIALEKRPFCEALWRGALHWFQRSRMLSQQLVEDWLRLNITPELAERMVLPAAIEAIRELWGEGLPREIAQILRIHQRFLANELLSSPEPA